MTSAVLNVGTWMPAEDNRLKQGVAKYGPRWVVVAAEVGTRNGDQCAKRWNENLNPELDHSPWCAAEDELLLHLVGLHGHNWKFITNKFFEKRAPLSLKNRNSYLKRRQKRQDQALASQRTNPQLTTTSLSSTENYTNRMTAMSDESTSVGAHSTTSDSFRMGSSHSRQHSISESEPMIFTSQTKSSTDLSDVFGTYTTTTATKQNSLLNTQRNMSLSTIGPIHDSQMSCTSDEGEYHYNLDQFAPFDYLPDTRTQTALDAFDNNFIPALYGSDISNSRDLSSSTSTGMGADNTIEYSLTCSRGELKSLVQHLVDAAIPMIVASGEGDEQQVVLNLGLRSCNPPR